MTVKLAILMDPIAPIDRLHDSSYMIYLAAAERGWELYYFQQHELYSELGVIKATVRPITVRDEDDFFTLGADQTLPLTYFDIVLMRKDPPFNINYIYTTYLLELAEAQGVNVFNKPQSLRDCNEKMFTLWFPELCAATVVSSDKKVIKAFWQQQGDVILKPLDGMGGSGIFYVKAKDVNANSIIETLTQNGNVPIMAQEYLPAIREHGDRRIILVNGVPASHALARIPASDDIRGNMVAGASIKIEPLTPQEKSICAQLGPVLKAKGLLYVGLDVIGNKVTEINVTSPTGAQEINRGANLNIGSTVIDALAASLA